ncbi:MAG: Glucan 1,3-beta-glucosidase 3 [Claussenomyces sp. TS43310]|nr:MAG: Glucan 1,3-beta-glucosidase 3 [Claussenomyces sp. TS43310]KAI9735055.1 MAG: Glucan 1,3-beta-glucosidase 3 [Claussenomyces sp. TS43310]
MRKFLGKAKASLANNDFPSQESHGQTHLRPPAGALQAPTPLDVLRYRYHHGTNLGSIFTLEKWLFGSMFIDGCPGGSELDAVSHCLKVQGLDATRQKWESHWNNAVSDADFEFLVREAKCTSIRLPIGYFTLGPHFVKGTSFEAVGEVYTGAWQAVKRFIARARSYGIGVLLDMHALPGGANGDAHSGSSTGKAEFWGSRRNTELATKCVVYIAQEVRGGLDGVIGIQLCNEAVWDAKGMYDWYARALHEIGKIDNTIPVYISDAWDLGRALSWTNSTGRHAGGQNPIVVDTHKYYTFSEADQKLSPPQILTKVPAELGQLNGKEGWLCDRGEAQVIVGEYSCVLSEKTWGRVRPEERAGYVQQFGQAQSNQWQQRAGGSYFWTWKMEWMDGGEWGFVEQVKKGSIRPPAASLLSADEVRQRAQTAQERRDALGQEARRGHEDYWNRTSPGGKFEHDRFSDGWHLGYTDALTFFAMRVNGGLGDKAREGADKISCLDIWVKKRLWESGQEGPLIWEWEQGFRGGFGAFNQVVGL